MMLCGLTVQRPFCVFEVVRLLKCENCIVLWVGLRKCEKDGCEKKEKTGFWQPFIYFITRHITTYLIPRVRHVNPEFKTRKKVG